MTDHLAFPVVLLDVEMPADGTARAATITWEDPIATEWTVTVSGEVIATADPGDTTLAVTFPAVTGLARWALRDAGQERVAGNLIRRRGQSVAESIGGTELAITVTEGDTVTVAMAAGTTPPSRTITAGAGLTGGGNLSADRTIAADLSSANAAALGVAAPGVATTIARSDHVHPMPSAANVGADPTGTAASAVSAHAIASDPHGDRDYTDQAITAAVTDIGNLPAADTPLDGTEKVPGDQAGTGVAITTEVLTPAPIDIVARRARDQIRTFSHLLATPDTYTGTDGTMFGSEPVVVHRSGTGSYVSQSQSLSFRYGSATCFTGSSSAGFAAVSLAPTRVYFVTASSDWYGAAIAACDVAAAGQDFSASVGWIDVTPSAAPTLGMFFRHTSGSANWVAVTKAAAGETTTDTGVAVTSSATWHTMEIRRAAAGNAVFYIGGVQVADHSTRLPDNFSALAWGASIKKTAGSTGRSLNIDLLECSINASAATAWGTL